MDDNSDVVICWMTENEKEKEASSERKKGKKKPAVAVRYIACFFYVSERKQILYSSVAWIREK